VPDDPVRRTTPVWPRVRSQQYVSTLVAIAIEDDKVHEMVLGRIAPLRKKRKKR
jgi:hypothetical protein